MDTNISTRIAHVRGDHHGEEEHFATLGCGACYANVGLGEPSPPRQPRWVQRAQQGQLPVRSEWPTFDEQVDTYWTRQTRDDA